MQVLRGGKKRLNVYQQECCWWGHSIVMPLAVCYIDINKNEVHLHALIWTEVYCYVQMASTYVLTNFHKEQKVKLNCACVCVCVCVCVYACTYTEWSLAGWTPLSSVCSAEWKLVREGRCLPSYFTHFFIIWFVANTVPVCEQAVLAVCKNILPLWSITCIFTFFNYWGKLGRLHLVSRSVLCGGNEELLFF